MPSRTVLFNVYVRDKNQNVSVPATITPFNDAPAQVEDIDIRSTFETILVDFTLPEDLDFSGVLVWMSTTSGFIPSDSNLVADDTGVPISIDALANTTYYLRIAAYDAFSKDPDDLNLSLERTITTLAVNTTSGEFSQSLTVSGVPVSTGTSNPTLQQIYNNGSVIVAIAGGKPVVASGTGSQTELFQMKSSGNNNATLVIDAGHTVRRQPQIDWRSQGLSQWFTGVSQPNAGAFFFFDSVFGTTPFSIEPNVASNSLYLNAPGFVGLNTSSPAERLHVVGSGIVSDRMSVGAATISGSAAMTVSSTTGGFLIPRMSTAQRDAISSPENGTIIYNTTVGKFQGREAGAWVNLI